MEIRLKNVSCEELQKINLLIPSQKLIAVTGENTSCLFEILTMKKPVTGFIYHDGKRILLKDRYLYQEKIAFLSSQISFPSHISTVQEYFHYWILQYHLSCHNETKKIEDAIHLVGLPKAVLTFPLSILSHSEMKLLQIASVLLLNPEVFLLDNPFANFDSKSTKQLMRLFSKMKEKYGKTFLFSTDDCELIYQYADDVILLKKGTVLLHGSVEEVYSNSFLLEKENISIPQVISFVNYVKKTKNIQLDAYKDIRDLIKDIYRKVS